MSQQVNREGATLVFFFFLFRHVLPWSKLPVTLRVAMRGLGGSIRPPEAPGWPACLAPGRMWDRPKGQAEQGPEIILGNSFLVWTQAHKSMGHSDSSHHLLASWPAQALHVVGTHLALRWTPFLTGLLLVISTKKGGDTLDECMGKPA